MHYPAEEVRTAGAAAAHRTFVLLLAFQTGSAWQVAAADKVTQAAVAVQAVASQGVMVRRAGFQGHREAAEHNQAAELAAIMARRLAQAVSVREAMRDLSPDIASAAVEAAVTMAEEEDIVHQVAAAQATSRFPEAPILPP